MASRVEELDNLGFAFKPAWHGLGTTFDSLMDAQTVLTQTSVGAYQVEQTHGWLPYYPETGRPWIYTPENPCPPTNVKWMRTEACFNLRNDIAMPDSRCLLSPTGVGEGYTIVQNNELVELANLIIDNGNAKFETAGTLQNGRYVWILARFPSDYDVSGDKINTYILIYSSHDGSKAITVAATSIRVVCYNTLSAALDETSNCIFLKHTANVDERIKEAIRVVQLSRESFLRERDLFNSMSKRSISDRFVDAYLSSIYPNPKGEDRVTTHAEKKRNRIKELLYSEQADYNGPGMRLNGEPTEYALYNAVTQYLQYDSIRRTRAGKDANEEAFRHNMWGTQAANRSVALGTLLRRDELESLVGAAVAVN